MGMNQIVFGWVLAALALIIGIVYNVYKYIERKRIEAKEKACKRDARNKYSLMINRIDTLEKGKKTIDSKIDVLLDNLTKIIE